MASPRLIVSHGFSRLLASAARVATSNEESGGTPVEVGRGRIAAARATDKEGVISLLNSHV
jgi:hypothetical protein